MANLERKLIRIVAKFHEKLIYVDDCENDLGSHQVEELISEFDSRLFNIIMSEDSEKKIEDLIDNYVFGSAIVVGYFSKNRV